MKRYLITFKKISKQGLPISSVAIIGGLLLASCAIPSVPISSLLVTATHQEAASPAPVIAATDTPTITATQPTPTFTLTPTLIGEKTRTPTETATSVPNTPLPTVPTNTSEPIPTAVLDGFNMITLSVNEFYIGNCEPSEVKFTAQVTKPTVVAFVVLFVRFKSATTGVTSSWTSITMDNIGAGTFTHNLVPEEMKAVDSFENPWVQYQLVATDANRKEVGRTQKFDELLRLKSCDLLTPAPTSTP